VNQALAERLESIYGIDLFFDQGTKDVPENESETNFQYVSGPQALAQELQRMFDLTPRGAFLDDLTYGIDWPIGETIVDPRVMIGRVQILVLQALRHPSFNDRFKVRDVKCGWTPKHPTAIYVQGILQLFGYEDALVRFGPFSVNFNG
jgi:hypothetical protein